MPTPFPGMDPWLEHPELWPDVHNRLIAAIADDLAPRLAPKYYVGLEERTFLATPAAEDEDVTGRPDLSVVQTRPRARGGGHAAQALIEEVAAPEMLQVELPMAEPVAEWFLEIRRAGRGKLVTVLEVLSPTNKSAGRGRRLYLRKRQRVLGSRTSLVEIDLLRAGRPMPILWPESGSIGDYRILVARGSERPRATVYTFGLRQPIPVIPVPLLPDDEEPGLDLGAILHALYDRARFDLRLDYTRPPVPPLAERDAGWARDLLGAARR